MSGAYSFPTLNRSLAKLVLERTMPKVGFIIAKAILVVSAAKHVKWSCFLGQVCGLAKMHLVCVHAAFRISAWVKYAVSGVRLSSAV